MAGWLSGWLSERVVGRVAERVLESSQQVSQVSGLAHIRPALRPFCLVNALMIWSS